MTKSILLAVVLFGATACHEDRPPAPTKAQSAQLNDAEEMLNDAANEEGPAERSTGPSNSSE